jgi:hypothetical protein
MLMKLLKKYAPALLLLGAAVTVRAQSAPPTSSPTANSMRAEEILKEIEDDNRHILHLQALARKEKDVIKLTCLNDKLVQVKAQLDLADASKLQLDAAGPGTDADAAAALEKTRTDIKKLRGEADACAGALEMYKQESKSDVDRPDLPDDPTDGDPFNPDNSEPEVDVPGFATPFR